MKNISISFFTFLNLLLFACCSKEEPCPTCFENVVTCKINGKEWRSNCVSNDPLFGCSSIRCYYYYNSDFALSISGVNDRDDIRIGINQLSSFGGAKLGLNTIQQREFLINNGNLIGNCKEYLEIDANYKNIFELIKIDTTNYFIEGNFHFKIYNLCGDTAVVTDGYFKTKFIF